VNEAVPKGEWAGHFDDLGSLFCNLGVCAPPKEHCEARSLSQQFNGGPVSEGSVVAKRVLYEGRVQGVGFRFSVKSITTGYDVVGGVKNLIDGRVELEVQGEEKEVDEFLEAILKSHLRRHINRFIVREIPLKSGIKGFEISS
jgi:acylphosphatase